MLRSFKQNSKLYHWKSLIFSFLFHSFLFNFILFGKNVEILYTLLESLNNYCATMLILKFSSFERWTYYDMDLMQILYFKYFKKKIFDSEILFNNNDWAFIIQHVQFKNVTFLIKIKLYKNRPKVLLKPCQSHLNIKQLEHIITTLKSRW